MSTPIAREVWFVTGSQTMYGEQTLRQVAEQSQDIARALADTPGMAARVVWKPVLSDAASIRRLCLDATAEDSCVGLIAWMHTFSPAKMWIAGLDALGKPLLHLHTQANVALPWATIDMDFMNLNQAAHGDREFGYIQTRLGVARKTVAGHVSDPDVTARVAAWTRAATGCAEVRQLRLVRFGDNMRDVAVTEGDKVAAQLTFGVSVNTHAVSDLVAAVDAVEPDRVTRLAEEYADTYQIDQELRSGGARYDSLRYAAQIELALRDFLTVGGYGAFTTNFQDLGGLRQLPGIAVQRLMADGYGFGGEGDWKTSVLVRTLKAASAGLPGGTSFMEDYTYNLVPGQELILGAHMLEVCPSIAAATPSCEIHRLSIVLRWTDGKLSSFTDSNFGAVLRWTDGNNWYKAYIDGQNLVIQKKVAGATTILARVPFAATAGIKYTIHFRVIGSALTANVWPATGTEPPGWMAGVTDTSLSSGNAGMRLLTQGGTATITAFQASAL